jgi:hypothetical protein
MILVRESIQRWDLIRESASSKHENVLQTSIISSSFNLPDMLVRWRADQFLFYILYVILLFGGGADLKWRADQFLFYILYVILLFEGRS